MSSFTRSSYNAEDSDASSSNSVEPILKMFPLNLLNTGKIFMDFQFEPQIRREIPIIKGEDSDSDDSESEDSNSSNESSESSESSDSNDSNDSSKPTDIKDALNKIYNIKAPSCSPCTPCTSSFLPVIEKPVQVVFNSGYILPEDEEFMKNYTKGYTKAQLEQAYNDACNGIKPQSNVHNLSENPIISHVNNVVETDVSISGKRFNVIYQGVPLVKLTNESCIHNGFEFVEGLNIDVHQFRYDSKCGSDGLYFCNLKDVERWLDYGSRPMVYMWDVTIPDDAKTMVYGDKFKADKFILSNKRSITPYLVNKVINMIANNESIDDVLSYIDSLSSTVQRDPLMDEVYITLLINDYNLYSKLPYHSEVVNYFVASNDVNGYDKLKHLFEDQNIVTRCVERNINVFKSLSDDSKTEELSNFVFDADSSMYPYIPDSHKTLEMTLKYIANNEDFDTKSIPKRYMNVPMVNMEVLPRDGLRLADVNYKNKDYALCVMAVRADADALRFVPLEMYDDNLCSIATLGKPSTYEYIPVQHRSHSLKANMVKKYPESIKYIHDSELAYGIIAIYLENTQNLIHVFPAMWNNPGFKKLVTENSNAYAKFNPQIMKYIDHTLFSDDVALDIISKDDSYYEYLYLNRDISFKVECVKIGLKFTMVFGDCIEVTSRNRDLTSQHIEEMVEHRMSVIDELPERYKSDSLYLICVEKHGMELNQIPEEFLTSRLLAKISNSRPESLTISVEDLV